MTHIVDGTCFCAQKYGYHNTCIYGAKFFFHLFFDINYYISNFAIKKNKNEIIDPNQNKTDLLSSFYLSSDLKQIDYALLEYKKLKYKMDYSYADELVFNAIYSRFMLMGKKTDV